MGYMIYTTSKYIVTDVIPETFNNIVYSSNKKPEGFNTSAINLNNPYQVFSPSKNLTPFKESNANLDKMFFSNLNSKN